MTVPGEAVLGQKVGPLPLVGWVGMAAGAVAIFLALKTRKNSPSTGVAGAGIDMLSPSTAEAFGTLQQQQADLTTSLGQLVAGQHSLAGQVTNQFTNQANLMQGDYWQLVSGESSILNSATGNPAFGEQAGAQAAQANGITATYRTPASLQTLSSA